MSKELVQLKPLQIAFAEWLATPLVERQCKTQKEFAEQLGVAPQTLNNWKQLQEVWDYRDSILRQTGKDLVPEALKKLKQLLESPYDRVAMDAAKDVLSRWSDPKRNATIAVTLKELYQQHDSPQEPIDAEYKEIDSAHTKEDRGALTQGNHTMP